MNDTIFPVPDATAADAHVDAQQYEDLYRASIADPETFWSEHARTIDWIRPFTRVRDVSYASDDVHIRWFQDGTLNVSANCIDRHLASRRDQAAIVWEGDTPGDNRTVSYGELHEEVCRIANVLLRRGVRKGDRVTI